MTETLTAAAEMCVLPEGVIPEFGITIISFIDTDGEQAFGFATHGTSTYSSLCGLMAMVSHHLLHTANDYSDE